MSLVPLLFSDWWEDLDHPHRLQDQHFGLGLHPEQLTSPAYISNYINPLTPRIERRTKNPAMIYLRPWGEMLRKGEGGTSVVKADKDQFHVSLDIQQFKPEEINVKVVDKCVVVEGKHEEKQDEHGWISRQFTRKYLIPEQCDIDKVSSSLSSDGVLSITAPRKDQPKQQGERSIKIEHTGKPAIRPNGELKKDKVEEKQQETKK